MKLQEHDYGFEAVLPENRTPFTIESSAKLFDILSSGIYKDKILAVIRELSCNAYDAHISANKKHTPFKLRLPTRLDPTFYVEDEGTGIDPDQINTIYWTYGRSSKTNSNDQIGALGLGSKSPFAYTKSSFVVKNRYQGAEHTYLCFINQDGKPDGSKVSEEPTDKHPGVTVEFAVRTEDVGAFRERTSRFFKRWSATLPIFVDHSHDVIVQKVDKVIEGTDWYLEKTDRSVYSDHQGAIAIQGNVPYPIEFGSIPKLPKELEIIASNPFIITFDMGEINFAASREALSYDERTCANIIARLQEVRREVEKSFNTKVFKPGMTHLEFMVNFRQVFTEFMSTIRTEVPVANAEAWYVKMLLSKLITDDVSYDGISWSIKHLIDAEVKIALTGHQSFGITKAESKRHSSRVTMNRLSHLIYTTKVDVDGTLIYPTWNSTSKIKAGEDHFFDWTPATVSKRVVPAEMTTFQRIFINKDLFSARTKHVLPIKSSSLNFYINDVGSSGESRYKALDDKNGFFVNFNPKISTVLEVIAELNILIEAGLKGAKIFLISDKPDNRPAIEKVKIETGTMRTRYRTIVFDDKESTVNVAEGAHIKIKCVDRLYEEESILKIADLQAEPIVPYVVKRRSRSLVYDDFASDQRSIINNHDLMQLAANYVIDNLVKVIPSTARRNANRNFIRVLVLNEGQVAWLQKRKVPLIGLRNLITAGIKTIDVAEKFSEQVENASILRNVQLVVRMFEATERYKNERARLTSGTGLFKSTFSDYVASRSNNKALAEPYAKARILAILGETPLVGAKNSGQIAKDLGIQYPMLKMINFNGFMNESDVHEIINYIEQMDV